MPIADPVYWYDQLKTDDMWMSDLILMSAECTGRKLLKNFFSNFGEKIEEISGSFLAEVSHLTVLVLCNSKPCYHDFCRSDLVG